MLMILVVIGVFIYFRAEHWRMSAVVEERSRMAREIHDTLAQSFAGIALQLESALRWIAFRWRECARNHGTADGAAKSARGASLHRGATHLAHRSVVGEHVAQGTSPAGGRNPLWSCLFPVKERRSGSVDEAEGQVLRIAQEGVANAIQHAAPTRITVRLLFDDQKLVMEIEDDGHGFDVSTAPGSEEGHFGITGMRERAASMKADLTILSGSHGTKVVVDGAHSSASHAFLEIGAALDSSAWGAAEIVALSIASEGGETKRLWLRQFAC